MECVQLQKQNPTISGKEPEMNLRSEADIINEIVDEILREIDPKTLDVAKYPVGLDTRIKDITTLFSNGTDDVIRFGIYGMGGVGKTTLAKALYNQLLLGGSFKGSCFLANCREVSGTAKGLVSLQQQLINDVLKSKRIVHVDNADKGIKLIGARICSTKVLVVIDDLDRHKLFEYLVGPFSSGSIVIVTTRDEELLDKIDVRPIYRYRVNELDDDKSLTLFTRHAFGNTEPSSTLMVVTKEILCHASGLPLALEVFGSYLYKRPEAGWKSFIKKLQRIPDITIQQSLIISLDALESDDPMLKKMFLDIACFFIGSGKEEAVKLLETYYSDADYNISILKKKCLIMIDDRNALGMHDLLRDMGREVSRNNSPNEPGKHSRLWAVEDICDVLKKNKGTEVIEGIIPRNFEYPNPLEGISFTTETFKRMGNLRFLHLTDVDIIGSFEQTFEDLRWLNWEGCPLTSFPPSFYPQKLVFLELPRSKMRTMRELNNVFENLKDLNMSESPNLTTTPDFTKLPCLQTLNLQNCESLMEVHESIGILMNLVYLNLCGCRSLKSLPGTICNLKALEVLDFGRCYSLEALPVELGNIKTLKELRAYQLSVSKLPDSIGGLSKLVKLDLNFNHNLETLPDTICNLRALEVLDFGRCYSLEALPMKLGDIKSLKELGAHDLNLVLKLPDSIGRLSKLVKLDLNCNINLVTLPDTICKLKALEVLNIDDCRSLRALPIELGKMESLRKLYMKGLAVSEIPNSIGNLHELVKLTLSNSRNLRTLPDTICSLRSLKNLDISGCEKLEILPDNFWNFTRLRKLDAGSSQIAVSNLEELNLSWNALTALPCGIGQLLNLRVLKSEKSLNLLSIAELPPNLKWIDLYDCSSLERLPNLSNLKQLQELDLAGCSRLREIQGLDKLTSLETLHLRGCSSSLQACTLTEHFFQVCSGYGHHIHIYPSEIPDWISQSDHEEGSAVSLDLEPDVSQNFLGLILCFRPSFLYLTNYSVKINATKNIIWKDHFPSFYHAFYMVIVPRSIFPVGNGGDRIEVESNSEICAMHPLYKRELHQYKRRKKLPLPGGEAKVQEDFEILRSS